MTTLFIIIDEASCLGARDDALLSPAGAIEGCRQAHWAHEDSGTFPLQEGSVGYWWHGLYLGMGKQTFETQ